MRYKITVRRFRDGVQFVQTYIIEAPPTTTVLDALINIREDLDGTVAFRYACRMGVCGVCAVKVNGRPVLACTTKLGDLGSHEIYIEPIQDKNIIKDLVVDI
ncbi:MAG: 2Fe-2S iron-sulfur cluster-binding protein [Pyrobaculum sp.]|uniref:2Fe-2S iron-sulfur cluster-binding protein n=1 Tax=Pyrobaculum sp. TaxID=2004705 RepID=UPI00317E617F